MKIVNKLRMVSQKGFTLIELLVVIAVIGVLAAIVLLAVNPAEQLMRARDTSRISAVTQIGRALTGWFTASGTGAYYATSTTWMATLTNSSDLKTIPANPAYSAGGNGCNTAANIQASSGSGYCFLSTAVTFAEAIVYAKLESQLYISKCTAGQAAWAIFSTTDARAGIVCTANATTDPVVGTQTFK